MPSPTRDEIKQAAEAMVEAYLSTRYPPEELTLGKVPGYHLARALLSAFEREEKMLAVLKSNLGDVKRLNELAAALGVMPFSQMEYYTHAAIKAAEEGR